VGVIAVALHDVEPRSLARACEMHRWLAARGVGCVTLLVIPAAADQPIGAQAPELARWLRERAACGDAIAQHGLAHRASAAPRWPRSLLARWQGGGAAEFPGLGPLETAQRVHAGRRALREIELDPSGFVAPAYAYTPPLRRVLSESFEWFADLRTIRSRTRGVLAAPALCLGTSTPLKRALSPPLVRAMALRAGAVMRLDIHPADFDLPRHLATLETLLESAGRRTAVTYDQLGA
jgi:predicted deacetylase